MYKSTYLFGRQRQLHNTAQDRFVVCGVHCSGWHGICQSS